VSSSAAFVTSAALTTINCYPTKPDVSKSLLSQLAIKAEHLVGVETGGYLVLRVLFVVFRI
jgi:galactokinase